VSTYNKFQAWAETMPEGANLATDQFTLALSNVAPIAINSVLADITEIAYTNLSARNFTTASSSQTGGTYALVLNDLVVTASGPVATFRYAVIYDDTVAGDPLVGWWDYGSSITMANAETFTVDFTGAALTLS
jgi:hypothetical protein